MIHAIAAVFRRVYGHEYGHGDGASSYSTQIAFISCSSCTYKNLHTLAQLTYYHLKPPLIINHCFAVIVTAPTIVTIVTIVICHQPYYYLSIGGFRADLSLSSDSLQQPGFSNFAGAGWTPRPAHSSFRCPFSRQQPILALPLLTLLTLLPLPLPLPLRFSLHYSCTYYCHYT